MTAVSGRGRELDVMILFIVTRRRRGQEMLRLVRESDPEAFITTESVNTATGGFLPHTVGPTGVRK